MVHNQILISPLAALARANGASAWVERAVRGVNGRIVGYADLLIIQGVWRLLVEAECSVRRVPRDLEKAAAASVHELWIVVPNTKLADKVTLLVHGHALSARSFVLTPGAAKQRLSRCLPFFAASNAGSTERGEET